MSGGDIPKSAMWLYTKIQHFKEQNLINIHDLANNFLERVEHNTDINVDNQSSSRNISDQESTEEKVMIKAAITEEEKKKKRHGLQNSGKSTQVTGLSKAIETLIEILFSGKVGQDNSATTNDIFKLDDINFSNQNIGKGEQDIALLSNETLKSLEEADLFSYAGFWTIMSTCIGKKFVDKKNNSFLDAINANMNEADAFNFTTTPALASACKQFHTNFENMWSNEFYKQDLRVVVTLLLRINLAKKRFFGFRKKHNMDTKKVSKAKGTKLRKGYLKQKMETLFEVLMKYQSGKDRKLPCITRFIKAIFDSTYYVVNKTTGSDPEDEVDNRVSVDEDKDGDGLDSNDDEEDFVTGAEMMTVPQEVVERDLSSKEINALVSVVMMLSGSETINGNANPNYVKNQLYKDKQELILEEALSLCAAIINTLRRIPTR
ncbi:hypothetical protein INT47_002041 [Mucor saturninus]|uniref:Uncharacterized protein n=1 Tax=Mucor saturninus TaxID=64648 RepID=A0A8H7R260_9FUNG|nr:hypothetical protein INT47_002041 [Mucor saturninus]